jgi:hypothetical protein
MLQKHACNIRLKRYCLKETDICMGKDFSESPTDMKTVTLPKVSPEDGVAET